MKKKKALSTFLPTSLPLAAVPATSFAQGVGGCNECNLFIFDEVAEPAEVQGPIQSITEGSEGNAEVVAMGFTMAVTGHRPLPTPDLPVG